MPDSLQTPKDFATAVERLVGAWDIDVLLPVTEASLLALLPERARFKSLCLPFPELDRFSRICDKALVLEVARSLGMPVPQQLCLAAPSERLKLTPHSVRFPMVVKSSRSIGEANGHRTKLGVTYVNDWAALQSVLDRACPAAYPILLQDRIVGPGIGIFLLVWDGEVVASFAHRRIREKPPSGGVSVYRESVEPDATLLGQSLALLQQFEWQGVAMVEFKVDSATGTPHLMEVNGRFWGSLQLAIDAGVDFPALLTAAVLGDRLRPSVAYRPGVKSRWWWGDVDHLIARLRRSKERLALPPNSSTRLRAIVDFLTTWRPGVRSEVLRLSDPMPFLRETVDWFRRR